MNSKFLCERFQSTTQYGCSSNKNPIVSSAGASGVILITLYRVGECESNLQFRCQNRKGRAEWVRILNILQFVLSTFQFNQRQKDNDVECSDAGVLNVSREEIGRT